MRLNSNYFDGVRAMRARLLDIEGVIGHPHARLLIRNARYSLGLVLEHTGNPHNPYTRAHNTRKLHGENYRAPQADMPTNPKSWPIGDVIAKMEVVRQELNDVARLIHSSLYLPLGEMELSHVADFVSRAWQDTLLARCYVSATLAAAAEKDLPPIEDSTIDDEDKQF